MRASAKAAFVFAMTVAAPATLPAWAATPISGALNGVANASIDGVTASSQDSQSWSGTPAPLAISVSAAGTSGADTVSVSGGASADWASANAGSVNFHDYGWAISIAGDGIARADLKTNRPGDDWTYTFTAASAGAIRLRYDVSVASGGGDPRGLIGWTVDFNGVGSGGPVINSFDPTQSGTFVGLLEPGKTYTIGLVGLANIVDEGPYANSAFMNGAFTWAIDVPEPSTWALLAAGFAGVGLARRVRAWRAAAG